MKLPQQKINLLIFIVITIIMIAALVWTSIFIYNHVYKIIVLIPELQELKTQFSFEVVRVDLFEEILINLNQKTAYQEINWLLINNPF